MTGASFMLGSGAAIPSLAVAQMREVDRAMVEDFHVELTQMMENAGRNLADCSRRLVSPRSVTVLVGPGGNGGGGLVAARHLHNRGVSVAVVLGAEDLAPVTAKQLDIDRRIGVPVLDRPVPADLVLDALIGYGLRGAPSGRIGDLVGWAGSVASPVLSLDCPSGLDLDSGTSPGARVQPVATMTLALPKHGLAAPGGAGELFVADISVPAALYSRLGIEVPALFTHDAIVELSVVGA